MPGLPTTGCRGVKWEVEGATESCAGGGTNLSSKNLVTVWGREGVPSGEGPDFLSPGDSL